MSRVLVVDDNETVREGMAISLARWGHEVTAVGSGPAALEVLARGPVDLVVSDLRMDPMDGLGLLEAMREREHEATVIVVTAFGTIETAVEAMRRGAYDFLTKPFTPEVLRAKVDKALEVSEMRRRVAALESENEALRDGRDQDWAARGLQGRSTALRAALDAAARVARTDAAVHLQGESGTGKELVARAIHDLSGRAGGPFVTVNCAALSESLLESELFGHERGAFTGAIKRRQGRFELAHRGTLFLDEIGDVSPALQVRLLRVLQEGAFERVGGEETVQVDVRVISATHRHLEAEVEAGRFREDLFYRLHVLPITLPPLRERGDDVILLARHMLARLADRMGRTVSGFSPEAEARLRRHPWPGNVRELQNVVEQALVFTEGARVEDDALPATLGRHPGLRTVAPGLGQAPLPEILESLERRLIERAWEESGGVKAECARLLGIKPGALYYKLDKYGLAGRGNPGDTSDS